MPEQVSAPSKPRAWLVACSGVLAGTRYPLIDGTTHIGRGSANEIIVDGPDCAMVSQSHAEITVEGERFRVHDVGSTNGTWLDGERVTESDLVPGKTIRLGSQGPEFTFLIEK